MDEQDDLLPKAEDLAFEWGMDEEVEGEEGKEAVKEEDDEERRGRASGDWY